jgi:RNA polymerase sigma-70 factor (ECF subfamily)
MRSMETACLLDEPAVSDEELMAGIARGDSQALADLYDRYNSILRALVFRVVHDEAESDDLLQEVFLQLWNQAHLFSAKKGKPLGWIVTLTRRRAIDRLRKRQAYGRAKERFELQADSQPTAWVRNGIDDGIFADEVREILCEKLDALPPLQRKAIELAYYRGMSQREIAAHTNTPLGTIKTRLELGLRKLADSLRGLEDKL